MKPCRPLSDLPAYLNIGSLFRQAAIKVVALVALTLLLLAFHLPAYAQNTVTNPAGSTITTTLTASSITDATAINSGNISTSGTEAHGIFVDAGTNALAINEAGATVITSGAQSRGIYAQADSGS